MAREIDIGDTVVAGTACEHCGGRGCSACFKSGLVPSDAEHGLVIDVDEGRNPIDTALRVCWLSQNLTNWEVPDGLLVVERASPASLRSASALRRNRR